MKYLLLLIPPIMGPFAVLAMLRALVWAAGGEWNDPAGAVILSFWIGVFVGGAMSLFISESLW